MFLLMYGRVTTPGTESGKKEKVREHQPSLVSSLVLLPDPETVKREHVCEYWLALVTSNTALAFCW